MIFILIRPYALRKHSKCKLDRAKSFGIDCLPYNIRYLFSKQVNLGGIYAAQLSQQQAHREVLFVPAKHIRFARSLRNCSCNSIEQQTARIAMKLLSSNQNEHKRSAGSLRSPPLKTKHLDKECLIDQGNVKPSLKIGEWPILA